MYEGNGIQHLKWIRVFWQCRLLFADIQGKNSLCIFSCDHVCAVWCNHRKYWQWRRQWTYWLRNQGDCNVCDVAYQLEFQSGNVYHGTAHSRMDVPRWQGRRGGGQGGDRNKYRGVPLIRPPPIHKSLANGVVVWRSSHKAWFHCTQYFQYLILSKNFQNYP